MFNLANLYTPTPQPPKIDGYRPVMILAKPTATPEQAYELKKMADDLNKRNNKRHKDIIDRFGFDIKFPNDIFVNG